MRHVQAASSVGGSSQSECTNLTSVSQQGGASNHGFQQGSQQFPQQQTQQASQYRVSRISEFTEANSFSEAPEHFVCELRGSPMSSPKSSGSVRAIRYYGGDEVEANSRDGEIRAIVSEISSDAGGMCNILLDSGADAAVFPMQFGDCGDDPSETAETAACLHDAQGRVIPVQTMRDVASLCC